MRTFTVPCGDHRFSVLASEEPGRRPVGVLMLHGVGARSSRWHRNLDEISRLTGIPAYAIDLPGHGEMPARLPAARLDVTGMASHVIRMVRCLGLNELVLVGTSLGGHVASRAAARLGPRQVRAQVLIAPAGYTSVGREARARVAGRLRDLSEEGIRAKLLNLVARPGLVTDSWVEEELRINSRPEVRQTQIQLADYIADGGLDADAITPEECERLAEIPTLLMWGSEDRTIPASHLEDVAHRLNGRVRRRLFDGVGHAPYLEDPDLFNKEVSDFIHASSSWGVSNRGGPYNRWLAPCPRRYTSA